MSVVTDIILTTAIDDGGREDEHPNADRLSAWLIERHRSGLKKVDGYAGGDKAMQCDVFMAAINWLDKEEFLAEFRAIPWDMPECVQLLLKGEQEDAFELFSVSL